VETRTFENCALLRYYAALSGGSLPTFRNSLSVTSSRVNNFWSTSNSWLLKMGPIDYPETFVRNCYSTLRNIPEERSLRIQCGRSLKSHVALYWSLKYGYVMHDDNWYVEHWKRILYLQYEYIYIYTHTRTHARTSWLYLYLKLHTLKVYKWTGGKSVFIINFGNRFRWVFCFAAGKSTWGVLRCLSESKRLITCCVAVSAYFVIRYSHRGGPVLEFRITFCGHAGDVFQ
jgi:hypothetical protein